MNGKKTIEIREWDNPYRGILLIHTGQKPDLLAKELFDEEITPLGAILGSVELVEIKPYRTLDDFVLNQHEHLNPSHFFREGLYGWVFRNPKLFDSPIRAKGKLGLFPFKIDESVVFKDDYRR